MKKLHCSLFGHDLVLFENITNYIKEYECKNCKQQFTTSSQGNLIPLTPKYKEINSVLKSMHSKKRKRIPSYS